VPGGETKGSQNSDAKAAKSGDTPKAEGDETR